MGRFRARMDASCPEWEVVFVFTKTNLYYFTGTRPEGMLIIPRAGEATCWLRRGLARAQAESLFPCLRPMERFRDAAGSLSPLPEAVYLEMEAVPLAVYQRLQKYFPFRQVHPADAQLRAVRAVKSPYELDLMVRSGAIHREALEQRVPSLLRAGMSEADLGRELYSLLLTMGHHGVSRFEMFDTEMVLGQLAFGVNSLHSTSFNGPGGHVGLSAAVPGLGSGGRLLQPGDLVFIDIGCGVDGYHTDKTMTYMFGRPLAPEAIAAQEACVDLQDQVAARLVPGAIPAQIYRETLQALTPDFRRNFMGFGDRQVKFLGHGVGLTIDEAPVIAEGFEEPLQEGMVFAIEPKKGMAGVGMVGIENTFLVTPQGGQSLTGSSRGLVPVGF